MKCDLCEKLANRNTRIDNLTKVAHGLATDNERLRRVCVQYRKFAKRMLYANCFLVTCIFVLSLLTMIKGSN